MLGTDAMTRALATGILVVTVAVLPGCRPAFGRGAQVATSAVARTDLFFGRARADGTSVSEVEWQRFLDTEVTPRFPAGLTVLRGDGQYRDGGGTIVREPALVVVLVYSPGERDVDARIEAVRAAYRRIFEQEAVLRFDHAPGTTH